MNTPVSRRPAGGNRPLWSGPARVLTQVVEEGGGDEFCERDQVELSICDVGVCSVCGGDSVIFDHYLEAFVHLRVCREIAYGAHRMNDEQRTLVPQL